MSLKKILASKKKEISKNIISQLRPLSYSLVLRIISKELQPYALTPEQALLMEKYILKQLHKLPLKWQTQRFKTLLYSPYPDPAPHELLGAYGKDGYACYFCALYFNKLTGQVPKSFHIAFPRQEKDRKSVQEYKDIEYEDVRDVFMKKPKESKITVKYGECQYIFVERDAIHSVGVEKREFIQDGRKASFLVTDLESTLIDVAVAPHRAGGISSVMDAWRAAEGRYDIGKLYYYYSMQKFIYPFWQRIGFLMEKAGQVESARKWDYFFKMERRPFFLMHEYRTSWKLDEHWQIHYPQSINI